MKLKFKNVIAMTLDWRDPAARAARSQIERAERLNDMSLDPDKEYSWDYAAIYLDPLIDNIKLIQREFRREARALRKTNKETK